MSKDASSSSSGMRMASSGGGFFAKAGQTLARSQSKRHRARTSSVSVPALPSSLDHDIASRPLLTRNEPSFTGSVNTVDSNHTPDRETDARSAGLAITPSTSTSNTTLTSTVESKSPPDMIVAPFGNNLKRAETSTSIKPPNSSYGNVDFGAGVPLPSGNLPPPTLNGAGAGSQNPGVLYQHIHDMASKRISTLDYLRKAHEGRVYWFNTVHFSKPDLTRIPYFEPRKLARRATNYLLLGLSLPAILDLNSSTPLEYLRALNALLAEFEAYQQVHPPDGSTSSSLSRARIPHMFKRATTHTNRRRTSSATEIGLPMQSSDPSDLKSMASGSSVAPSSATTQSSISSFPSSHESSDLLPGEEYIHLLTPSLPFDPDFFETFATLCDVLIDCYTRIVGMISSPSVCSPAIGEVFVKADARLRKVIVAGVVREFEDASRNGAKSELAGVGKVVLGGLMGG